MNKNSDTLLLLVLLFLLSEGGDAPSAGSVRDFSSQRYPQGRLRMPEPIRLIGDFHRMTEVMGKVDHLGQMALHPPKLPAPAELGDAKVLPDLDSMIDMLGPILQSFRSGESASDL